VAKIGRAGELVSAKRVGVVAMAGSRVAFNENLESLRHEKD
jgi:hypothetical protein